MRILDVDLDFFLSDIARDRSSGGERLSDEEFRPWDPPAVREFLERRCRLSTNRRIPGKVVTHHHEAFYWWRDLIRNAQLTVPFEIVHVDAHADLGSDTFGFSASYVAYELLHQPLKDRENPAEGGSKMNAGNYLLVAIACRWVSELTYVMHPKNTLRDCPDWLFAGSEAEPWTISLPKLQKPKVLVPGITPRVLEREPTVAFIPTVQSHFKDKGDFDFMVLCQSPGFTPKSSDLLLPVIQAYMGCDGQ